MVDSEIEEQEVDDDVEEWKFRRLFKGRYPFPFLPLLLLSCSPYYVV